MESVRGFKQLDARWYGYYNYRDFADRGGGHSH